MFRTMESLPQLTSKRLASEDRSSSGKPECLDRVHKAHLVYLLEVVGA